jgi:hypothetical protein
MLKKFRTKYRLKVAIDEDAMKNLQILLWIIVFTPALALQADTEETDYPAPTNGNCRPGCTRP